MNNYSVPVRFPDGQEQHVSIGMIIAPRSDANQNDLTRSQGQSNQDILSKWCEQWRSGAVASGKEYAKFSTRIRAGGLPYTIADGKCKRQGVQEKEESP